MFFWCLLEKGKNMGEPAKKYLSWVSDRRFGVELEILAFDGKSRPEGTNNPQGIDYVAMIVSRNDPSGVNIRGYEHTDGNDTWIVKPDSSCGMELCTPIYKGWHGLKKVCDVVYALNQDHKIKVDERCSVHVHVEIADLTPEDIATVIAWWFKVEPIFMDSVPPNRKRNRYCQFMGMTNLIQHDSNLKGMDLVKRVGNVKYYSLNTNQFVKNGRKSIEFRIIEGEGCRDPYLIKNWVRLLIHFIEMARKSPFPAAYEKGNPWSGFCWLDTEDVFKFLGFAGEHDLSPGLLETRNWFLARLQKHMAKDINDGPRFYAYKELNAFIEKLKDQGITICPEHHLTPSDLKSVCFCEETKI